MFSPVHPPRRAGTNLVLFYSSTAVESIIFFPANILPHFHRPPRGVFPRVSWYSPPLLWSTRARRTRTRSSSDSNGLILLIFAPLAMVNTCSADLKMPHVVELRSFKALYTHDFLLPEWFSNVQHHRMSINIKFYVFLPWQKYTLLSFLYFFHGRNTENAAVDLFSRIINLVFNRVDPKNIEKW